MLAGEVEADTAFGVAGGVENVASDCRLTLLGVGSDGDEFSIVQSVIGVLDGGSGDAEPCGLNVHHFDLGEIVLVVEDGGASELLEAVSAGNVVDMGVGDEDLLDGERVPGEEGEDARDIVAGIDDDGFVRGFVAEDAAVALEGADGDGFEDHVYIRVMDQGNGIGGNA